MQKSYLKNFETSGGVTEVFTGCREKWKMSVSSQIDSGRKGPRNKDAI